MELASITPEQWRVVWGFVKSQLSGTPRPRIASTQSAFDTISFRNDSGEEIPAFAAMRVTGVQMLEDQAILVCNKPDSSAAEIIANGPQAVADQDVGAAYKFGVVQVKAEVGITLGATVRAKASSWEVEAGSGPAVFLGYDTEYDCGLVRLGVGGATLFRFELNAAFPSGTSVSATIKSMDGTTVNASINLQDPEAIFLGLADEAKGYCLLQGGVYYPIQAACGA